MGLIKEPLDIDLYVNSRRPTKEDEQAISDYIKADKLKRAKKLKIKRTAASKTDLRAKSHAI